MEEVLKKEKTQFLGFFPLRLSEMEKSDLRIYKTSFLLLFCFVSK